MKIKSFIVFAITIAVILLMNRCEDEKPVQRDYPRLNTFPVTNISDSGALFTGEIYALGIQEILEYGFVWGKTEHLMYEYGDKVILGTQQSTGTFTAFISSTLINGVTYWVRPFAKTSECIVYGKAISFTSLGSLSPLITRFFPDSAAWNDTITITGKRFSWVAAKNIVKLNDKVCPIISSTDSSVKVQVPNSLNVKENLLTVTMDGNTVTYPNKKFRLIMPEITDFKPKQGRWGDTILITGKCLITSSYQGNSVKIGSSSCSFIRVKNDSIWIKVPGDVSSNTAGLTVNLNGLTIAGKQNFQLLEPYFTFKPSEGTWGSKITLSGRFNGIAAKNSFYIGGLQATVSYSNEVKAEIIVPSGLVTAESQIKYKATPFEINSGSNFVLLPPQIVSFSPSSGGYNTLVTITGNNFGSSATPVVKFGNIQATVASRNSTQIAVYVPNSGFGPVKISVTAGNQTGISTDNFDLKNSSITGFLPTSGTFKDQVTITGENFNPANLTVQIGTVPATVKSATSTTIIVEVPDMTDTVPKNIKVTSGQVYALSEQKFTLLPPEILSVTPLNPAVGSDIIISGRNFKPNVGDEKVFIDLVSLTIKSGTATQIIASVPQSLPRGDHRVKLLVGGYTRYSSEKLNINSPWLRIPAPILQTFASLPGQYYSLPVAGVGLQSGNYLCSVYDGGTTYRFDEGTQTFTKLGVTAGFPKSSVGYDRYVNCQNKLHVFYGLNAFKVFDETTESWSTINVNLPYNNNSLMFSLNDKIYYGGSGSYPYNPFYEIDPSNGYSVRKLTTFPNSSSTTSGFYPSSYFSWNNNGYVIYTSNEFYRYNPLTDSWTKLANFPATFRYNAVFFALGNYIYFGTGNNGSFYYNDIWRYDPLANTWMQVSLIPVERGFGVAFTANGKAYIGYGRKDGIDLYDFYEFDPSYISK
jgi:hypothetical protein